MKVVKVFLIILYSFIYGYSVYKTSVEPDRPVWGYICTLIFFIAVIYGLNEFIKKNSNDQQTE